MSILDIKVLIVTTEDEMTREILSSIASDINKAVRNAIPQFRPSLVPIITNLITSAPEYQSLLSGQLKDEFGMVTPDIALSAIVKTIIDSITVEYTDMKVSGNTVSGTLILSLLRKDYSDVLSLQDLAGTPIPWLQWLLTAGDSVVVVNYTVSTRTGAVTSRAGGAIMIRSGQGYRVPPQFAGTEDNNWLTRSLISLEVEIGRVMELEINRKL